MVFLNPDMKDSKDPEQTVRINKPNEALKMHVGIIAGWHIQEIQIYFW